MSLVEQGSNCLRLQLQLQRVQANAGVRQHDVTGEFSDHAMPEALPRPCAELGCTALVGVINGELTNRDDPCDFQQRMVEKYKQEDLDEL